MSELEARPPINFRSRVVLATSIFLIVLTALVVNIPDGGNRGFDELIAIPFFDTQDHTGKSSAHGSMGSLAKVVPTFSMLIFL
jgi:hypothetical protein